MKQKELLAFAKEVAKSMKTEKDLSDFSDSIDFHVSRMMLLSTPSSRLLCSLPEHGWRSGHKNGSDSRKRV